MLKICLTYDYELFLGENLCSYDEILFKPTAALAKAMSDEGVNGVFFADVCSALAYQKAGINEFSDAFSNQLKELTADGHDVQLHLHTSWLCATPNGKELLLSEEGYKIHDFGFDIKDEYCVQNIISNGKKYLEDTCGCVNKDYRCIAYRAGGFSIQPEEKLFDALLQNGIVIDSSVVPHCKALEVVNSYDFTKIPNKLNWFVDSKKGISVAADMENNIFEVPVGTSRPRVLECIGKSKNELSLPPAPKRGEYVHFTNAVNLRKQNKLGKLYHKIFDYRYISLDTRYYKVVYNDLLEIYRKHRLDKSDGYVCLICHPKLADKVRVDNISRLIEIINKDNEKFSFVTMADIYKEVFKK